MLPSHLALRRLLLGTGAALPAARAATSHFALRRLLLGTSREVAPGKPPALHLCSTTARSAILAARPAAAAPLGRAMASGGQPAAKRPRVESSASLDGKAWGAIRAHLETYDSQRETVIKRSREVQKAAKNAIYSLHRGDEVRAAQQLAAAEKVARELLPLVAAEPTLRQGSFSGAMEEYAEAMIFKTFLHEQRVLANSELKELVQVEEYLGGVLDFTGELNRHAVACATRRDGQSVALCRDVVDALMGEFLQLDLRNGALRKKFDALKYTLKKLETILYELSLTEATGLRLGCGADGEHPGGDEGEGGGGGDRAE